MTTSAIHIFKLDLITLIEFAIVPYLNNDNWFINKVFPPLNKVGICLVHLYNVL